MTLSPPKTTLTSRSEVLKTSSLRILDLLAQPSLSAATGTGEARVRWSCPNIRPPRATRPGRPASSARCVRGRDRGRSPSDPTTTSPVSRDPARRSATIHERRRTPADDRHHPHQQGHPARGDLPRVGGGVGSGVCASVLGVGEDLIVSIERQTGEVTMEDDEEVYEFDLSELGRIAAQAVKQGFMQRVREAERDVLYEEYETRVGSLVNGVVQRYEGNDLVVNLGKVEAHLSREDRVRGETYAPGDRIRAIVVEVRKDGSRVRILVSSHAPRPRATFVRTRSARDRGQHHRDQARRARARLPHQDGSHLERPQDRLHRRLRRCARQPHQGGDRRIARRAHRHHPLERFARDPDHERAQAGSDPSRQHLPRRREPLGNRDRRRGQQSLAIGKRGQNVRLASRLCGWEIDIKTRAEFFGEEGVEEEAAGDDETAGDLADVSGEDATQSTEATAPEASNNEATDGESQGSEPQGREPQGREPQGSEPQGSEPQGSEPDDAEAQVKSDGPAAAASTAATPQASGTTSEPGSDG